MLLALQYSLPIINKYAFQYFLGMACSSISVDPFMKNTNDINPTDKHRIIEMAWEDRTPLMPLNINLVFQRKKPYD